jgi:hypothetical protein
MKRCSISFVIREMIIKATMSYHFIPNRMVIMKVSTTVSVGENVEKLESSNVVNGNVTWYSSSEKWFVIA